MVNQLYYSVNYSFVSPDPHWHETYLDKRESRLTHLIRDDLGNSFWENYSTLLVKAFQSGALLLRAKVVRQKSVDLIQIWRSDADMMSFSSRVLNRENLIELIQKRGFVVNTKEAWLPQSEVETLILDISQRPHIWQFIAQSWQQPWMKLGDPLKRGQGYLPFPNE